MMEYGYERPVNRARGRLVASRQAFFEQAAGSQPTRNGAAATSAGGAAAKNLTSLVDEKLERFTRSTQEATRNLAKSTPDLTALEEDANIRVNQHLSKSRGNLNQTFDSSALLHNARNAARDGSGYTPPALAGHVDMTTGGGGGLGPASVNMSFSSYFTHKKPPLPPKKPSSPPPPVPMSAIAAIREDSNKENREPSRHTATTMTTTTTQFGRKDAAQPATKVSEFDRIVNSIKSTDTYRRYKNHPSLVQPPDFRRRSKSLGFLELDEEDNWVLPAAATAGGKATPASETAFPELCERSVSTTHLVKKSRPGGGGSSEDGVPTTDDDDDVAEDDDVPIPCNRLTAAKSEYELRVEKSLKNLTLPEWYTKSSRPSSRASILSGRGTPAMSSERFTRNRPDYESFRSIHSTTSSTGGGGTVPVPPKRDMPNSRVTTPSWRSFSSVRRTSPPTPNSEAEHECMEKTQNWINSQHSTIAQQQQQLLHPRHHQHQQLHHTTPPAAATTTTTTMTTTKQNLSSSETTTPTPTTPVALTCNKHPPYTGWRRTTREFAEPRSFEPSRVKPSEFAGSDTDYSSSFEEKRSGSERYSFVQAVNNSVLSEDHHHHRSNYLETSFDSATLRPSSELYHNKVWIESSLISRPVNGGYQKTDYQETTAYKEESFPTGYPEPFGVFEKREVRHPDMIFSNSVSTNGNVGHNNSSSNNNNNMNNNMEAPPRPGSRHPFSGALLEAVV